LLGISRDELTAIFGHADYRRIDQGVDVLQFRMPNCIIDFVLSNDDKVASFHGRHRVNGENYDHADCRRDLAVRRDSIE
jgi:hypothetical protein